MGVKYKYTDDEVNEDFIPISMKFNDEDITSIWKINEQGIVINTKSKNIMKIYNTSHGKQRSEHIRFSISIKKKSYMCECRLETLLQSYFPKNSKKYCIIHSINHNGEDLKLKYPYKICENGTVFTMNPVKKANRELEVVLDGGHGNELQPSIRDGYQWVSLWITMERCILFGLHRLLLLTFKPIDNCDKANLQAHHIDNNTLNNSLSNLQWVTQIQNCLHKKIHQDPNCSISQDAKGRHVVKFNYKGASFYKSFDNIELATIWRDKSLQLRRNDIDIKELRNKLDCECGKNCKKKQFVFKEPEKCNIFKIRFGCYDVYIDGRVWSGKTGCFLKYNIDKDGYYRVSLSNSKIQKVYRINRLIGKLFLPVSEDITNLHVDHNDRNKKNNHASNLQWMTPTENNKNRG
tara:strand:- start:2133 stop:3350 length:1218 start_codon:yes stop_codon:yes gene_type:complete